MGILLYFLSLEDKRSLRRNGTDESLGFKSEQDRGKNEILNFQVGIRWPR
jgi:hypothetical protein